MAAKKDLVARNLVVKLIADYETFIKKNKEGADSFGAMVYSIEKNKKQLREVGAVFGTVGAALGAALGGMTKQAIDFNRELGNVQTLIPGTGNRIEELRDAIQDMTVKIGKNAADLTQGAYQVISAFGDTGDTVAILETSAKGAAAGLATTTESINLLSAVTKGYGDVSADSVSKVSDMAFQTVKLGQTTFPELAGSIGRVVPLAAELKVSQEELFAVMATGTGVTGGANEVSTQLRGVLQSLLAPTADMTKLLDGMGYESGKALLQSKGLNGALETIVESAKASGQPLQKYISSIEGQTIALALTGSQAQTYVEKLGAMQKAAGATEEAFLAQTQGVNKAGFAIDQMKQSFIGVSQTIGQALVPYVAAAATAVKDFTEAIRTFLKEHPNLTKALASVAAGLSLVSTGLGLLLIGSTSLPKLKLAIQAIGTAFTKLGLTLSSAGPVGLALAGAAAAIYLVYTYWDELAAGMKTLYIEIIQPVVEAMKAAFTSIWEVAKQVWSFIWDKVKSVLQGMWDFFSPVVDFYIKGVSQIWEIYKTVFGLIWDKVKTVIGAMYDSFRWLLDKLGVELPEIGDLFKGIGDMAGNVADAVTNKWDSMKETYRRQMDAVKSKSDEINDAIKTKTVETVDAVVEEHERAATAIQGKNTETKDFIINDTMPALRKVHTETVEAVEVEWKDYEQDVAGENGTMARVRDGITSQFDAARNTINGALKSIGETFTEDILKGNFSTAIKHLKDSFDETIKKIRDNFVNSLAQGLMGWVEGGFKDILGSISGSVSKVIGGLGSGAASTATSGTAAAGAGGLFSNLGGAAMTAGIGLAVSGVIAGLTALFNRTPPSEKRRRDDANDALPAVAREVEEAVNAGKMSEEEAAFRLKMVEDAAAAGEILNYLLVQPTSKARLDYWKGEDMSKHSATRARALWQWADEKWAEMGNTVGAPLSTVTFHQGGVIEGVLGQEKLIRALVGEEVLTRDDPRHRDNLGGGVVVNVTGNYINSELDLERLFRRFSERLMREMNIRGRVYA